MFDWGAIKIFFKTERFVIGVIAVYIFKLFYQTLILKSPQSQNILFVMGCQRSGTSLMTRVFTRDLNVGVYREASRLSSNDKEKRLRLNAFEDIERVFGRNKAPLIVLKPLVESQNTLELLDYFPRSKALWMYRHYKDVAKSNVKRFKPSAGVEALQAIIDNDPTNWRSEKVSAYTRSVVLEHFSPDMGPADSSALFWLVRNQLFFDLDLTQNSRVFMCRYEDLVTQADSMMARIYRFANSEHLYNSKIVQEINPNSVGKGQQIKLSPAIEAVCQQQLERLEQAYTVKLEQFSQAQPTAVAQDVV